MVKKLELPSQGIKNKFRELKCRLFFVFISLIIFRIGSFVPIPGINISVLAKLLERQQGTIVEIFNMFSGGALSRASIFALGIMPYISASIIIQLLTTINLTLSDLKKEGESGRRKIVQYTRYATLALSILQSIGIATALPNMPSMKNLVINPGFEFYFTSVISLVTGTMFLMWLGEKITQFGIGNGISIIIFSGIISGFPQAISNSIRLIHQGELNILFFPIIAILVFTITFFVVFVERGQRRIVVSYAKRQQGRRIYAAQNTHLPIKVNMAGVIPAIFASSIILFPATLTSWFGRKDSFAWLSTLSLNFQPGKSIYVLVYAFLIIFFCFFYTSLVFNPRETADHLKKSGAFIPGIRPGEQTAKFIHKISTRLTLVGACYITFICLIPEFIRDIINVPFYFSGTSLLIIVVVIMDFMIQVQTLIISNQYNSTLRKINTKKFSN